MKIRVVAALFVTFFLITLVGCGGSGDSGPLFSPDELEVMTALDAFAAAIRDEQRYQALEWVESNLQWGNQSDPILYDKFSARLDKFIKNNRVKDFRFDNMGVSVFEFDATARAEPVCLYIKNGETVETNLRESIVLELIKKPKWNISKAYPGFSDNLQFPPE